MSRKEGKGLEVEEVGERGERKRNWKEEEKKRRGLNAEGITKFSWPVPCALTPDRDACVRPQSACNQSNVTAGGCGGRRE